MAQTIRLTVTPDLEKALQTLRQTTMGTLNTTELIKMAIGGFAQMKKADAAMTPQEMDVMSSVLFHEWSKEDENENNIAHPEKLKPFIPKPYVRTR
ncbi:MAG TPA: hypothetical protein VLF89_04415 [Candidatus Saccharimonadales bacterium]|nr:hypothetical protein [Candidatus Saccharimonadales bacterium]